MRYRYFQYYVTVNCQSASGDWHSVAWWLTARDEVAALNEARRAYDTASVVEVRREPGGQIVAVWGSGRAA